MDYRLINAKTFDDWNQNGWEWGIPIAAEIFAAAKTGNWNVLLTPTKPVPKSWFPSLANAKVLGLASGGGQQMPIFAALGAVCTVLDYSESQLESERLVSRRENYEIEIVRADMTKPLPFANETFDMIFHPVSNCYVENVEPIWAECYRVLKKGGRLLAGLDNGLNFVFGDQEGVFEYVLPYNPLNDKELYEQSIANGWGIQFSHTIEEQIGGQLMAGFTLKEIYQDTNGSGLLHNFNLPTFYATLAVK
ncbi:class I SAM-dependent methyltransferase [Candidatus Epulonipiscium viviparus]|uniref:class I SAM-dependent methyltransferase n=1 Tax=Candidatus Epulonipiscium viviparus TaxID=420336 RepID=UPI00273813D3|nr:class I SAM-dependent methyltransferase [Candidatus Epulopiscium viviparus]